MHKTIGILGGMSPESTVAYYEHMTRAYVKRCGDCSYPRILIYSVSFQTYIDWPREGRWDLVADGLSKAAQVLEAAGADLVLIATNTMHLVFDEVEASVGIPVLSLLDAVGEMVQGRHLTTVGLLGTRFTMETTLYPEALAERGISVLVPDQEDRALVDRVIYDEMRPLEGRMDFEFERMQKERVEKTEEMINIEVAVARPISTRMLPREEAFQIPDLIRTRINLLPEHAKQVRVVAIQGLDLQADVGTHVANTKEVGPLRVIHYMSKGRFNKRLVVGLDEEDPVSWHSTT